MSPDIPPIGVPLRVAAAVEDDLRDKTMNKPTWSLAAEDLQLDVWRRRYWREDPEEFGYRSIYFRFDTDDIALSSAYFVEWSSPAVSFLAAVARRCDVIIGIGSACVSCLAVMVATVGCGGQCNTARLRGKARRSRTEVTLG